MNLSVSKIFKDKRILVASIIGLIALVFILAKAISNANPTAGITYRAHVAYNGWLGWVSDGATAGTVGESRRMEAIKIKLTGDMQGDVVYQSYVRDVGWQNEVKNSETSGVEGQSKQMEAIKIHLTGAVSESYNVVYRVHLKNKGWLDWVSNGEMAGSDTERLRIEAIEIKLEPKQTTQEQSTQYENNRGKVTTLSDEDLILFSAIIYCESGAESYEGKLAVANVILNRLYSSNSPGTLHGVIYAKGQFSPVTDGSLSKRLSEFRSGQGLSENHKQCIEAAKEAAGGHNNIGDRDGFMTPSAYTRHASKTSQKLIIGGHVFFKW